MKVRLSLAAFALFLASPSTSLHAQDSHRWIAITDPSKLYDFLSGKTWGNEEVTLYYRSDSVMDYQNKKFNTVVVRKWVVTNDGRVCTYINVKPDKLVTCMTFARSANDRSLFQMVTNRSFIVRGHFVEEPPKLLVDAVNEKAGPAN